MEVFLPLLPTSTGLPERSDQHSTSPSACPRGGTGCEGLAHETKYATCATIATIYLAHYRGGINQFSLRNNIIEPYFPYFKPHMSYERSVSYCRFAGSMGQGTSQARLVLYCLDGERVVGNKCFGKF